MVSVRCDRQDFACVLGDSGRSGVLRLAGEQVESLFDEALPIEVRELPADLARLDELLGDHALLGPIAARWEEAWRDRGRPTIAMTLFVRLLVIKRRTGWGYETLVREVSDSFHRRRFVGLSVTAGVPHESSKLLRRLPGFVEGTGFGQCLQHGPADAG